MSRDIMFFSPTEELCFKMNAYGRTFHRGKSIGKDVNSSVSSSVGEKNISVVIDMQHAVGRRRTSAVKFTSAVSYLVVP